MTRKDYTIIANAIRTARIKARLYDMSRDEALDVIVVYVGNALIADNPAFSRERFIAAATGEE